MTLTIIFASSLFVAGALVLIKAIELKFGRKNFALEILAKLDCHSVRFVSVFKFRCLQIIQTVRYIILVQTKEFLKELLHKTEERIAAEYRARHNALMGHREIATNSSASFYLKKIIEHKGTGRKGRIEESL